ncbi:MAG: hypothetical protein LBC64_02990 [Fibromonadaceae bacterium]|jgi:hypothetical protein|nr:hypothetical protein [Fibromonadaceae bacterium]
MEIGGYGAVISGYGAQYVSQTSSIPFTIPIWGGDVAKKENTPIIDNDPFRDGSIKLPEWMNTKTEPTRSDEEILRALEELAKEHAKAGESVNRFEDKKYKELMYEYVSSVSPDRAGILSKSVPEINGIVNAIYGTDYNSYGSYQQVNSQREDKTDEDDKKKKTELIDYFLEALKNKGEFNRVAVDMSNDEILDILTTIIESDTYAAVVQNGVVQQVEFSDPSIEQKSNKWGITGNSVMIYRDGKFIQGLQPEEVSRRHEALARYEAAYDIATGKLL